MSVALITGAAGLVGSESALFFAKQGFDVVGIDNDMRRVFFGEEASTRWRREQLQMELGDTYRHVDQDIRNADALASLMGRYGSAIKLVIHTAAQPSHDWAARDPTTDFTVNANGTLNMLEATRRFAPDAVFIFCSTNKVYGDRPNDLPLIEQETRWEIDPRHTYANGIREDMSVDQTLHSLFGASKLAADALVQEYGRYFGLRTACFRGGCLTGPNHSGAQLHGFLAYLMRCGATEAPYTIFGYKGKQVRDNIHSTDLARAFFEFFKAPRAGEVYNIGGGRRSHCSMLEAIELCEQITGRTMRWQYSDHNRTGDHIWYVSDLSKFRTHYPDWQIEYDVPGILQEIYENELRALAGGSVQLIDHGKHDVLGVLIDAVDYDATVERIATSAAARQPLTVSALAVHGVMTGVQDDVHRHRLNHLDLVVPDGQPVRWALNWLHGTALNDRVYGPDLTLKVCERAAADGLPIYLYGSRPDVLDALSRNLRARFPTLTIAGMQPSRFRQLSLEETEEVVDSISKSGARIVLVGLGCPRQEVWVYEHRHALRMPLLAVGAAFDFHAGRLPQAPKRLQKAGLEWAFRLLQEPRRLWRRYVLLNPLYATLVCIQAMGLRRFGAQHD